VESEARTPVTITLIDCSSEPAGAVTTFVRVMYDFQHQRLEAYKTGGGDASSFKWQVSTGNAFVDIPGAPNSKYYTVPANFYADAVAGILSTQTEAVDANGNKSLNFRCILTNPAGTGNTAAFNLVFINTSTYATINGRKYVTLGKGSGGKTVDGGSTATMQMLLLNLGQSGDNYNLDYDQYASDAGDLGDFYQWGRVADGHQNTVWYKGTDHIDSIGTSAKWSTTNYPVADGKTSGAVVRGTATDIYDTYDQVLSSKTDYFGKFITYSTNADWNINETDDRWGGASDFNNRASDIPLSSWAHPSNNPCPSGVEGWKVPSRWNWWDLVRGDGVTIPSTVDYNNNPDNTWCSFISNINGAIDGTIIISNATGERVFLPAAGTRNSSAGTLSYVGSGGYYWAGTYYTTTFACYLQFYNGVVTAGHNANSYAKTTGFSVRCVAEF
jgi:hypothetical protein